MLTFDERQDFPFFGASNETQAVVRAYNAICTPDLFVGFNTLLPKPQLRGEFDALHRNPVSEEVRRSLSP